MSRMKNGTFPATMKRENTKGVMKRLLSYLFKNYTAGMIAVIITMLLSTAGSLASAVFIKNLIDQIIMPALTLGFAAVKSEYVGLLIIMSAIFAVGVVSTFVQTRLLAGITHKMLKSIRVDMFDKMEKLPIKYFDTNSHGDIMSRYTNDIDAFRQVVGQSIPQFIISLLTIIALFAIMLLYSVWLTLVVIATVFIMLLITKKIGGGSAKYFVKQQASLGKLEGYVEEMLHGQKVVKVFCHEEASKKDFDKLNDIYFKESETANKLANVLMPILNNMGHIMYVLLAIVGAIIAVSGGTNLTLIGLGAMSVGTVVSFLNMSKMFTMSISQVSQQINVVAMGIAGAARVFKLLDEPVEVDNGYVTLVKCKRDGDELIECAEGDIWAWRHPHQADGTVTYVELKGDIVLKDVDFAYEEGKQVLFDISMYAHFGQKIALVGATGAGKTTITNLLNRFYDIADGKVRYDGININKIKKPDLRRSLGIVLQDTNLFTGTVMDNIRYGRLDATDDECIAASKLANAHDFITRLPDGYNTLLTSDGTNLSQGQRQLLSIARAAVANAPVMILDEATSSIDTRTELLVQRGMDSLMAGRTVFVIAHRLSTVKNADAIMVLDHGKIIERGSHDELIKQKGTYYKLYTGKFELE